MAAIKQPRDKSHFILPDLGEGVHEAELIKWRVKPGESVDEHQTLAEMETDKALVEVPSPWAGVVKELNGNEGDIIIVGSILVTYDVGAAPAAKASTPSTATANAGASDQHDDDGTVVGTMDASMTVPASMTRRHVEENGEAHTGGKALATPAVRRIARELGIDINRVPGTGRGGRVTASDVQTFAGGSGGGAPTLTAAISSVPVAAFPTVSADGVAERIPFRGMRRKIAQALDLSVKTAVHFTVVDEADVTRLDAKRKEYSAVIGQKLSYLPFIMRAVCRALRIHPTLNANVDDIGEEILIKSVINLGCAVDTEHGLMVPVIDNADQLSPVQLGDRVTQLAAACRGRTVERERLVGGTFTISNVGSYGGRYTTPIINYPEVGILAAGRVYEQVLTRDGVFYAGKVLPLSLSCDHRVVDGAESARFLNTVVKLLEEPETLVQ